MKGEGENSCMSDHIWKEKDLYDLFWIAIKIRDKKYDCINEN